MRRAIMANVEVSCTISNCVFHAKGNICGAEKITIDSDNHASHNSSEFAAEFDVRKVKDKAQHSSSTCCKTFKAKFN